MSDQAKNTENKITREEDEDFIQKMDSLVQDAEDMRLRFMHSSRSRGLIANGVGLAAIVFGAAGFGWYFLVESALLKGFASMILGVVIAGGLFLWSDSAIKEYKRHYKLNFLPKLAKLLGGFKYHPSRGISAKIIAKTGVLPAHEVYDAEDCFMGNYKGVKVLFSEARLKYKKAYLEPIFDGLFVLMEIPEEDIVGHTILTADKEMYQKWRGSRWAKLQDVDIKTQNEDWDRFHILSDKPEHAQKVVNERLIKELAEAAHIFDDSALTAVLFRKKYIFMMIPYDGDMFEASNIHIPVKTRQHTMKCRKEIEQLLEVIDVFQLYHK